VRDTVNVAFFASPGFNSTELGIERVSFLLSDLVSPQPTSPIATAAATKKDVHLIGNFSS
jgi:hypothetical protein